MKRGYSWLCLSASLALAFSAASSFADDNHYVNIIIGDRASGLAGAYTAVSDDSAGMYYNPAGIVFGVGDEMSASMNAYQKTKTTYDNEDWLGGENWNRESGVLIPNFFGVTRNFGNWAFGFNYAVPDSSVEDQNQELRDIVYPGDITVEKFIINYREELNVLLIGPSIAYAFNKDLSAGLTLNYYSRKHNVINNQYFFYDANGDTVSDAVLWNSSYFNMNEQGVKPILGIMWSPADTFSIGARASHTFVADANTRSQKLSLASLAPGDESAIDKVDVKREYPYELAVGIAWFPNNQFMLSGDFSYWTETGETHYWKNTDDGSVKVVVDPGKEITRNAAVGMEYYPSRSWALRAGFFTNRASVPEVKTGQVNRNPHVDLYGGTLSATLFSKGTSITMGAIYSRGKGEAQLFEGFPEIQDVTVQATTIFFSTAYNY